MLLATARVIEEGEKTIKWFGSSRFHGGPFKEQGLTQRPIRSSARQRPTREGKISNGVSHGKAILNHQVGESVPVRPVTGTYKVKNHIKISEGFSFAAPHHSP